MILTRVYFTFGSWEQYPFPNRYMVVEAETFNAAIAVFRSKYPDVHENTLRCADFYREEVWNERIQQYYKDSPPAEVLRSEVAETVCRMQVLLENAIGLAVEGMVKDSVTKQWLLTELGTTEEELKMMEIDLGEIVCK